ncbi:hypothetical protein [Neomoorella glycerini]|uniref:hypothetical protein n=1 Tax=Neomoorella glycerini TaxID=55779 RepID=UPI0012E222EB|nr:hypothetical protein [Moorella glycerini]
MEARLLVRVKLLFSLAFAVLGAVLVSGILYLFLRLPPPYLTITFILGLLSNWPVAALGLIVDLSYPRLDWVDPQQAMKSNFNGLIAMQPGPPPGSHPGLIGLSPVPPGPGV